MIERMRGLPGKISLLLAGVAVGLLLAEATLRWVLSTRYVYIHPEFEILSASPLAAAASRRWRRGHTFPSRPGAWPTAGRRANRGRPHRRRFAGLPLD